MWWCHRAKAEPKPAPSAVQLHWVINRKKNGPLYLSGAGQESSADVIKILSSPVKDTYHSSSAQLALSEKESQLNRWGLSFHSCKRLRLPPVSLKETLPGAHEHPRMAANVLRHPSPTTTSPQSLSLCARENLLQGPSEWQCGRLQLDAVLPEMANYRRERLGLSCCSVTAGAGPGLSCGLLPAGPCCLPSFPTVTSVSSEPCGLGRGALANKCPL